MTYEPKKIIESLLQGVMHFRYRKNDGSIRDAYGTLNIDCVPAVQRPKGAGRKKPASDTVTYYDIFSEG